VQLLKSFFCLHGYDNRLRFLIITTFSYFTFILLSFIDSAIIPILALVVLTFISSASTLRRLNDAKLNKKLLYFPSVLFLFVALLIITTGIPLIYVVLLLPYLINSYFLTFKENSNRTFIFGYAGPVDLNEYVSKQKDALHISKRIEPVLVNQLNIQNVSLDSTPASFLQNDHAESSEYKQATKTSVQVDFGEQIREMCLNNKRMFISVLVTLLLVLTAVVIIIPMSAVEDTPTELLESSVLEKKITRLSPVTLPDNFTLMLSEHQGVIINWQADETEEKQLWSLTTAQGDNSCKELHFNNGDKFRSLAVLTENKLEYFANFSPLDTKEILKSIAFRGNFSLCGYTFSLKGSQATLGKHPSYSGLIDY